MRGKILLQQRVLRFFQCRIVLRDASGGGKGVLDHRHIVAERRDLEPQSARLPHVKAGTRGIGLSCGREEIAGTAQLQVLLRDLILL